MDESPDEGLATQFKKYFKKSALVFLFISNMVWTATAFYCLIQYHYKHKDFMRFAFVTFIVNALFSIMGLIEIVDEFAMSSIRVLLEMLQVSLAFPCLTTQIWLDHQFAEKEVAWVHTIIGLIPIYIFLTQNYLRQDLVEFTVVVNVISLFSVGCIYRDIYPIGSAIFFSVLYSKFFFRVVLSYERISEQFYRYCIALFTYCSFKSVV